MSDSPAELCREFDFDRLDSEYMQATRCIRLTAERGGRRVLADIAWRTRCELGPVESLRLGCRLLADQLRRADELERAVAVIAPADSLDIEYDGVTLRLLLSEDEAQRRGEWDGYHFTPGQRAAISAHWSAELRRKVGAGAEAERQRVVLDTEDE